MFSNGMISSRDFDAISEFSSKFIVPEEKVTEFIKHLENLRKRKDLLQLNRKDREFLGRRMRKFIGVICLKTIYLTNKQWQP